MDLSEVPTTPFRRHPWEVARARFFRTLLARAGVLDRPASVLDVGAGDGYLAGALLAEMKPGSRVVCFDPLYRDDELTRFSAASPNVTFTRSAPGERFDIVLLLDVIEHVEHDRPFLSGFVTTNLADHGVALISVPAWQRLFTEHDVGLKHFRRYSPAAVRDLAGDCGLSIRSSGGLFHGPLLPRALTALREAAARRLGRAPRATANLGQWAHGPRLSSLVEQVLFMDNVVSNAAANLGWSLPGLSFWALCEKRSP